MKFCPRLCLLSVLLLLGGCADLGYYWHSARGHMALMNARVDIPTMLEDPATDEELRQRLELVLEIREFARDRLALPLGDSYREYVALDRPYVLRNLFAAPEFSTRLHQWCYPVIGCASYRGYFDDQRLENDASQMKADGLEIHIGRVPAYSTLGWFDDPVLSSFVNWPEYRLAGLLFHELTHQQLFIEDDTTFNESLASAVQQAGTELWLAERGQTEQLDQFRRWQKYRGEVIALIESTRANLDALYRGDLDEENKRRLKAARFEQAREQHAGIAAENGISGGFSRWFESELNNAKIGSVSAYNAWRPAFGNMITAYRQDFGSFYRYAEAVSTLDQSARDQCLRSWHSGESFARDGCPERS